MSEDKQLYVCVSIPINSLEGKIPEDCCYKLKESILEEFEVKRLWNGGLNGNMEFEFAILLPKIISDKYMVRVKVREGYEK